MHPVNSRIPAVVLLASTLATLFACGSETPEARLGDAGEKVEEAEETLESLDQRIDEHERALDELRDRRRKMKDRLRTLEERLAARATDVALFRAVQSALLDEPGLKETAINVLVEDKRVTLVGAVPSADQRDRALAIARAAPGVGEVASRLRIHDPEQAT
jgi:osmotically-inducible protein OsmY